MTEKKDKRTVLVTSGGVKETLAKACRRLGYNYWVVRKQLKRMQEGYNVVSTDLYTFLGNYDNILEGTEQIQLKGRVFPRISSEEV